MLRIIILLCCIVGVDACASAAKEDPVKTDFNAIYQAYNSGQSLLLYHISAPIDSEAYFDWYSYLSDFQQGPGKSFYVQKLKPTQVQKILPKKPSANDFSIFIKKGQPSYFYSDIIMEPQVYHAVINAYAEKTLTEVDRAFLPEIVRLVNFAE